MTRGRVATSKRSPSRLAGAPARVVSTEEASILTRSSTGEATAVASRGVPRGWSR